MHKIVAEAVMVVLLVPVLIFVFSGCGSQPITVGPSLGVAKPPPAPARPVNPTLDKAVSRYVPAGFSMYGAATNLSALAGYLGSQPNIEELRQVRSVLPSSVSTGFAAIVASLSDIALEAKLVNASVFELCEKGGALAMAPNIVEGSALFLVVLKVTPRIELLFGSLVRKAFPGEKGMVGSVERWIHPFPCGARLYVCRVDDVFLAASDDEVLKAAIAASLGKVPLMAESPLVSTVRARLQRDSLGFAVLDVPAVLGRPPAFPSRKGAVIKLPAAPTHAFAHLGALAAVRAAGIELVEAEDAIVVHAKLIVDPEAKQLKKFSHVAPEAFLRGPRVVGESVALYLGLTMDLAELGIFDAWHDLARARQLPGLPQVESTVGSFFDHWGLSWDRHIKPWVGNELSLFVIWELRYPQIALMLETKDSEKSVETFLQLRSDLEGLGQIFASRIVGKHRVFYTRYQGADPAEFEPSVAITPEFVIMTTGRRAIESILEEREKLEGTPGISTLCSYLGGNMQHCVRLATRILDRVLDPSQGRLKTLTPRNHGLCNKNLVDIESGKCAPSIVRCPGGGVYSAGKGAEALCSVHGSLSCPLDPHGVLASRLAVVRHFRDRYSSLSIGAGRIDSKLYQATVVVQRRKTEPSSQARE